MLHASERRVLSLIQHIDDHPHQTENELAEWLNVEVDALDALIAAAEAALPPGARIVRGSLGWAIEADDARMLSAWRRAMQEGMNAFGMIPSTPEERASFLLGELLSRTTWITIDALADLVERDKPDCLLLGSQVSFLFNEVNEKFGDQIPAGVIDAGDYGSLDGERVLKYAVLLIKSHTV